ncbi:MAG TPA: RlmE family RNA methyltransferase [Candidatus Thermoplasmatota archaeon]|nr:RlmE family RNA methyltransferase [Candidatus Thermoplasmatota archaeon]
MGKNWFLEKKKEPWYRKAKREGFRARSAFKLQQIQERHEILREGDTVIDLGAAPGGWSQVAKDLVGPTGRVIGVDLAKIVPMEGVDFVRGDITKQETLDEVLRILARHPKGTRVDAVISDMSPPLTGNYTMDQANSVWLCEHAVAFARKVLDAGGRFLVKIFEGEDYAGFRDDLKATFHSVKPYNPPASRKQSSEIYLIATGFKPSPSARTSPAASTQGPSIRRDNARPS